VLVFYYFRYSRFTVMIFCYLQFVSPFAKNTFLQCVVSSLF